MTLQLCLWLCCVLKSCSQGLCGVLVAWCSWVSHAVQPYLFAPRQVNDGLTLSDLPLHMLNNILYRFSDGWDIVTLGQVTPTLSMLSEDRSLWKKLCQYHFAEKQVSVVASGLRGVGCVPWRLACAVTIPSACTWLSEPSLPAHCARRPRRGGLLRARLRVTFWALGARTRHAGLRETRTRTGHLLGAGWCGAGRAQGSGSLMHFFPSEVGLAVAGWAGGATESWTRGPRETVPLRG